MPLYGYARVSTLDQDLSIQRAALKAAGCEVIRAEKASGSRRDGRTELQVLLDFLRAGDTLVVTRIDRLARSLKDLQDIVHELKARGVALKATEQPVDTGTAAGKAFLDMLGVFAEFETNLRRERQLEGSAPPRRAASTRAASRRSMLPRCVVCGGRKNSGQRQSPAGSALAGLASTACSASKRQQHERERRCRSGLRCAGSIRSTGRRSVGMCGSNALAAFARDVAGHMARPFAVCRTAAGSILPIIPGVMIVAGQRAGPISSKQLAFGKLGLSLPRRILIMIPATTGRAICEPLSALPSDPRPAASFGATADHLFAASCARRSVPRSLPA